MYQNTTTGTTRKHSCLIDESSALLHFKSSFEIVSSIMGYPKTRSWRNGTDCCSQWDGVTCNPVTGHVIGLDLSSSQLDGTIGSNSSLFLLGHLESLNLAYNEFSQSSISPKFGELLLHLKYLNLSDSGFSGEVPVELSHLRNLTSLDLSRNDYKLAIPSFKSMIGNLTKLKHLDLSTTSIYSSIPQSLTNLSSLESLTLYGSGLRGELPRNMHSLSRLRVLYLSDNDKLYAGSFADELFNWSTPLEVLDLSDTNFSQRKLPKSITPAMSNSLRTLNLRECSIYGPVPPWVWNVTQEIDLANNDFIGELPLPSNLTRLSTLSFLTLGDNSLTGTVPSWLFHLPSITYLLLNSNQFGGNLIDIIVGNATNSLVESIDLSDNKIYGSIPESLFHHSNLKGLDLHSNNLTGTIELHMFSNLKNLVSLQLSNNCLSVLTSEFNSTLSLPNLSLLELSSCNMNKFPFFGESTLQALKMLDLSKNKIQGEIPKWFHDTEQLSFLDLSYNYLTAGLENLPSMTHTTDVSHNVLQGPLPLQVFLPNLMELMASNNRISGPIHSSICNSSRFLGVLDLSNNMLDGPIPDCLGSSFDYLGVLNLGSNNLSGGIPPNFSNCDILEYIDLSNNRLEGVVPPSLAQCSRLEVVNLGNNMLNDTFPHLLATLSDLKVLNLRSNYFHGPLITGTRSHSKQLFSKLRVLDLSRNHFNGTLPSNIISNMRAMKYLREDEVKFRQYLLYGYSGEYFSVTITIKGSDLQVERILNTLTTIDVSSNMFEGDIPTLIGDLGALHLLNLSHNNFAGKIPPSIGNIKALESLDLSCNNLSGEIPKEVGRLGFLEMFNVSYNQLVGPIPQGPQLGTFQNESYLGNPGLCGPPLSKKCSIEETPVLSNPPDEDGDDEDEREWWEDIHLWQVIVTGYGLGLVIGLVSGYFMLSARNPLWLSRLVYNFEYRVSQWLKMRGRGQRTRAQRN